MASRPIILGMYSTCALKETKCNRREESPSVASHVNFSSEIVSRAAYLAQDRDWNLVEGLGYTMFHNVEHILVVQQTNQVERAKTRSTAQGQVSDNHRAAKQNETNQEKVFDISHPHPHKDLTNNKKCRSTGQSRGWALPVPKDNTQAAGKHGWKRGQL